MKYLFIFTLFFLSLNGISQEQDSLTLANQDTVQMYFETSYDVNIVTLIEFHSTNYFVLWSDGSFVPYEDKLYPRKMKKHYYFEDEFHNTSVQQKYWDMTIRKKVRKTTYAGFISYRDSLRNLQHIDHAEY